jgi:hypothetical protein
MAVEAVAAPDEGVWRIGRAPDPLAASRPLSPSLLDNKSTGNRFDSPTGAYRVLYFSTTLDGCYGETLARFRPDPQILSLVETEWDELGFMQVGDVPTVRGGDRRVTRWIGQWAYDQTTDSGEPRFAGIRYVSRLSSEWECWAVFDDVSITEMNRRPILAQDEAFLRIAKRYRLTPH